MGYLDGNLARSNSVLLADFKQFEPYSEHFDTQLIHGALNFELPGTDFFSFRNLDNDVTNTFDPHIDAPDLFLHRRDSIDRLFEYKKLDSFTEAKRSEGRLGSPERIYPKLYDEDFRCEGPKLFRYAQDGIGRAEMPDSDY